MSSDLRAFEHDELETRTIKTQPRQFAQPQQPQLVSNTEKTLTLNVIPADETKNKCSISVFNIRCTSTENESDKTYGRSKSSNVTIEDLLPYHNYSCAASIDNENSETSVWSSPANFMTKEGGNLPFSLMKIFIRME